MSNQTNAKEKAAAKAPARMSKKDPLTKSQLELINAWWRASNYLAACQLYLLDNPLLREPLKPEHLKRTIVGHWGTCPGQNFIYTHLNRVINKYDLDMIYLSGPGHGGNAMVAQDYLDGSYTEIYPNISRDAEGMKKLFKQFSFPGGIASHVAPETPGSINEGGELGYSLSHAFGAVMDNPDLIAACVVGDGEAETGPLATAWHSNKFLNPKTDGAVLPILHLNGFKIANPTVFSRISHEEAEMFFKGCGWEPRFVEGDDPMVMHQKMAAALDWAVREIQRIQEYARSTGDVTRPRWPMIVLRSPKGWTGPKEVDGKPLEGCWRAHQGPTAVPAGPPWGQQKGGNPPPRAKQKTDKRPRQQPGQDSLPRRRPVVLVVAHQRLFYCKMIQQLHGHPRILGRNEVRPVQCLPGPGREVPQISDGRSYQIQCSGHSFYSLSRK